MHTGDRVRIDRIKAVLIGEENVPVASGSHDWENRLVNQIWTYTMEDIWSGLQACYADLKTECERIIRRDIDDVGGDRFQRNDARLSSV